MRKREEQQVVIRTFRELVDHLRRRTEKDPPPDVDDDRVRRPKRP